MCCEEGPYQQGDLDGLCGLYATINAMDLIAEAKGKSLTCAEARRMFLNMCKRLEKDKKLACTISDGLQTNKQIRNYVFDSASTLISQWKSITVYRKTSSARTLKKFWKEMQQHFQKRKARAIVLRLAGKEDHWTCVRGIDDDHLFVLDSGERRVFEKSHCTIGPETRGQNYPLRPRQSWFLWAGE
jgi:hypothetical protein